MDALINYSLLTVLMSAVNVAIIASISGYTYVNILTKPDMILGGWKKWLWAFYFKIFGAQNEKYAWIMKPIVECDLCVSGQISLWIYLIYFPFSIVGLIFSICLTLLMTRTLARINA